MPHVARLEASRSYIEETAERIDAGEGENGKLNTEGAIAKFLATEAGNMAADASIQALGGYGYTHEYMVEKIKRDVRITTIYEGTSEIMEMTISRDRWQLHLKTRGQYYHEQARALEAHARDPSERGRQHCGAGSACLGRGNGKSPCRASDPPSAYSAAPGRTDRLCRVCRQLVPPRGAFHAEGKLNEKANTRFDATALAALGRIFAREAALKVAEEGLRWVRRRDGVSDSEMAAFEAASATARHSSRAGRPALRHGLLGRCAL